MESVEQTNQTMSEKNKATAKLLGTVGKDGLLDKVIPSMMIQSLQVIASELGNIRQILQEKHNANQ